MGKHDGPHAGTTGGAAPTSILSVILRHVTGGIQVKQTWKMQATRKRKSFGK
jgi:hypothetical protein